MQFAQAEQDSAREKFAQAEQDLALERGLQEYSNMEGFDNPGDFLSLQDLPQEEGSNEWEDLPAEDDVPAEDFDGDDGDDELREKVPHWTPGDAGLDEAGGEALDSDDGEELWTPGKPFPGMDEPKLVGSGVDDTATVYLTGWETQVPGLKPDAEVFSHYQLPVPDTPFAGVEGRP